VQPEANPDRYSFRAVAHERNPEDLIPDVLAWLPDAAGTYFEFVFGGVDAARAVFTRWLARESSEISIRRVTLLRQGNHSVGGFLALTGADLSDCQRADSVAILKETGRGERDHLIARMRMVSALRPPVDGDAFYLSMLGVVRERRGQGLGRALVHEYLTAGRRVGIRRFRLDVQADNLSAISLYRSVGMAPISEATSEDGAIRMYRMAKDEERVP
jgi:ribosomal protein S18 acetylase RimI-like enzyme